LVSAHSRNNKLKIVVLPMLDVVASIYCADKNGLLIPVSSQRREVRSNM